jgi:hypothetical protein
MSAMTNNRAQAHGCAKCWPESADSAWEARSCLDQQRELIDDSHFHVLVLSCPECGQAFLSVFMESIDWDDGDDPQFWSVVPIEGAERDGLYRAIISERDLQGFARGRRSLFRAAPKGRPYSNGWATGIVLLPHD